MDSSPRDQFFFISLTVFIARSKNINTKTSKTQQNNNALESLLPSPHPKVGHPKLFVVLLKDFIPRINPD